jgi:hypothetical protein
MNTLVAACSAVTAECTMTRVQTKHTHVLRPRKLRRLLS